MRRYLLAPALLAGLGLAATAVRDRGFLRDPAWLLTFALFAAALVSGLLMVRSLSYTGAFAAVLLAGAFPRFMPRRITGSFVAAALAAFAISPTPIAIAAGLLAAELKPAVTAADRNLCTATASFEAFARLEPGLVLADVDAGPHLIAHTPHSALAAPYHRMNEGIASAHDLWAAAPGEAAARLRARGIAYVMLCPARGKLPVAFPAASLRMALENGEVPAFLEAVPAGGAFNVWRVR